MQHLKHKHLVLNQQNINAAKRYFVVASELEAIDKALAILVEEQRLSKALRPLKGALKGSLLIYLAGCMDCNDAHFVCCSNTDGLREP